VAVLAAGCSSIERRVERLAQLHHLKIEALQGRKRVEAVSTLTAALRHADRHIRARAARILGRLRDPPAVRSLVRALRDDESLAVRETAARALGCFDDPWAIRELERATVATHADVRAAAVVALYGRKGSEDIPALAAVFEDDPDPRVRRAVVRALQWTSSAEAIPILLAAAGDPDAGVRRQSVCCGAKLPRRGLGEREFVDVYVGLLSDADESVGQAAACALGTIGNRHVVPALAAALDRRGWPSAAEALARLRDLRALPALARALRSDDVGLRAAAARALGRYGPRAVGHLAAALKDDEEFVRHRAFASLGMIGTAAAVGTLISALPEDRGRPPEDAVRALVLAMRRRPHDISLPRAREASVERWKTWWERTRPKWIEHDEPRRVSSRSGRFTALVGRQTLSLVGPDGKALWTKLIACRGISCCAIFRPRVCLVSDRGWVLFRDRFISRKGAEPGANPVRRWFPGGWRAEVFAAAISPDGRQAVVLAHAGEKGAVVLCDERGESLWKHAYPHRRARLLFSPDGRYIACLPSQPCTAALVEPLTEYEWLLSIFSREGGTVEIQAIRPGGAVFPAVPGPEPPSRRGDAKLAEVCSRFRARVRSWGGVDCTPLVEGTGSGRRLPRRASDVMPMPAVARTAAGWVSLSGHPPSEAPLEPASVPWETLAEGDGVLLDCFWGLFFFPRSVAPRLVGLLSAPEPKVARLSFEVLREMAGRTFGYFPGAPEEDRARAIERWREWAARQP
jgi:HEAT repeat protein